MGVRRWGASTILNTVVKVSIIEEIAEQRLEGYEEIFPMSIWKEHLR